VREVDLMETVREGLLMLDSDLTIRFANRSFCRKFAVTPEDAVGRKLYEAGDGQWDILELLPTDRAITIGLMVNELVTNAVKYAFPDDTKGSVLVTLKRAPGELRLTVSDDGKGIDPGRADSGVGGRLIEGFAQQLGGQLKRETNSQGTTVLLILPSREGSWGSLT